MMEGQFEEYYSNKNIIRKWMEIEILKTEAMITEYTIQQNALSSNEIHRRADNQSNQDIRIHFNKPKSSRMIMSVRAVSSVEI